MAGDVAELEQRGWTSVQRYRSDRAVFRRLDVRASVFVEHLAQFAGEGFGLAGVSELAAEEATVVARVHGRLLTEQFGGGDRRASRKRVQ
jgi:hypothetical protein